jgi:hypothetical protein
MPTSHFGRLKYGSIFLVIQATFYIAAIYNTSLFFRKTFYVEVGEYPKFPFPCWREVQEVKFENVNRPVEKKEEIKKKPDSN